jgi:hypothetical protein
MCLPLKEGGLGIRYLTRINEGANLKMCWELLNSNHHWAIFLKSVVLKGKKPIAYHVFSSIWSSIKDMFSEIHCNSFWNLGNCQEINFWIDNWCGESLVEVLQIPTNIRNSLTLDMFIANHEWSVPYCVLQIYPNLPTILNKVTTPLFEKEDNLVWKLSQNRELTFKDAYLFNYSTTQNISWANLIWNQSIPLSKSMILWRCLLNKLPTDDNTLARGCQFPYM